VGFHPRQRHRNQDHAVAPKIGELKFRHVSPIRFDTAVNSPSSGPMHQNNDPPTQPLLCSTPRFPLSIPLFLFPNSYHFTWPGFTCKCIPPETSLPRICGGAIAKSFYIYSVHGTSHRPKTPFMRTVHPVSARQLLPFVASLPCNFDCSCLRLLIAQSRVLEPKSHSRTTTSGSYFHRDC